jgi:hypothetical protein
MKEKIKISIENTNDEILARIAKAISKKFNCSLHIDYSKGKRVVEFIGNPIYKSQIAEEIHNIFKKY